MYSLEKFFKDKDDKNYKFSVFEPEIVKAVEDLIYTKQNSKGIEEIYIKCQVRNKEIKLTPEEAVRQLYIYKLVHNYGYLPEQMKIEHVIHFGRELKRADIVIFEKEHPDNEYIIIEIKRPKLQEGKAQLKSYCNATGAIIGVWTNGEEIKPYHRKDPNYFEQISDIPKATQKLKDVLQIRWTIENLKRGDKLLTTRRSLTGLIREMEDEVLANAGVDVFEEVFKLIYSKLFDEFQCTRDKSRNLEFRNYGNTDQELKDSIQNLFDKAKNKWQGVFPIDSKIILTPSHLAICVSSLQDVKLFNSNLEVIDDAFEYLMSKSQKGEKGQFFTPRYVIDMCVKMLNPQENEFMIDTAAGSCGFPVHTIFHVWSEIYKRKGKTQNEMFTAEAKDPECLDYVNEKVFAIDFDEKAVRVAKTLNLIAGDGKTNVMHLNSLDYERWSEVIDENWIDTYNDGWKGLRKLRAVKNENCNFNFDIVMANPPFAGDIKESRILSRYELGKNSKGVTQNKIGRDILFIERNLQFLKPGGRMAIILPQGRFNNSSDEYIRNFIMEHCRILAVVALHENVFKPHTGTKTSVLFVQKWDDELCPQKDDYPIFFATMKKPSKDNSGDKIYRKDADGKFLLDEHNHLIVDHDLFNHNGLTQDGIAEAFIEFAKRENLSFFAQARLTEPFNAKKYNALLDGLECCEVLFSYVKNNSDVRRLDSFFYSKEFLNDEKILARIKTKSLQEFEKVSLSNFGAYALYNFVEYVDDGVPFIRCTDMNNGMIDFSGLVHISEMSHKILHKSEIFPENILVSTTGTIGKVALASPDWKYPINANQSITKINLNGAINPYYVYSFLQTRYFQNYLIREARGSIQQSVYLSQFGNVKIPLFREKFYKSLEIINKKAFNMAQKANQSYKTAQEILNAELNFDDLSCEKNIAIKNLSEVRKTGRLDAEYFMPEYDEYHKCVVNYKNGYAMVSDFFNQVQTKCSRNEKSYKYIEIGDVNVGTGFAVFNTISTDELPDNAKIMTLKGDLIVSKVRPNRGAVAILDENNLLVSGAFTVLREKTDFKKEVLQIILRSDIYKSWLLRFNVGTSYPVIKDDDVLNILLPLIDSDTQNKIAELVQKSFMLRKQSENLINMAVKSVEIAIEQNEDTAMLFIKNNEF